ncbi:MAG: exodeoxyribonuclease VII large subunit [Bacteroidales bacterium]|nr:exodeoxyribonuclease VII large subunit [Bacteroidales bacterium]
MSEIVDGKKVFTLGEFAASIKRALGSLYNQRYWLKAELTKLNFFPRSGHCYPELSETDNGSIAAAFTGFIHKNTYKQINEKFLTTIGEPLHDGMKIVAQCSVQFSTTRGIKLTIHDIDINSILGEQARMRQETVECLKSEGLFARNKSLALPRIIKRLAIVSVESGKGYADFMSIISGYNVFRINVRLFPALMMGPEAAVQIKAALDNIKERSSEFDAVCIIRGGGGENTLQCFNDTELCRAIALFPLPVLTGIGHATNRTVAEETAQTSFVSPSELANFFIDRHIEEVARFKALTSKISLLMQRAFQVKSSRLNAPIKNIRYKYAVIFRRKMEHVDGFLNSIRLKIKGVFYRRHFSLYSITSRIARAAGSQCQQSLKRVEHIEAQIHGVSARRFPIIAGHPAPMHIAAEPSEGVCILRGSQVISSISVLNVGDIIRIITPEGSVSAEITASDLKKQ